MRSPTLLQTASASAIALALALAPACRPAAAHESSREPRNEPSRGSGHELGRARPFKFAVVADSQWGGAGDTNNPNTVAVGIIDQINRELIRLGVELVVQVGDLTDDGSEAALRTRAGAAQALYDAGIGFFPLRGNHESSQAAALAFQALFPQTRGAGQTSGAARFSSPSAALAGLSYAFTYENARFVLLDQYTRADGSSAPGGDNIADQQAWIDAALEAKPRNGHAFVFGHAPLIGQSHADVLFGASPAADPESQNAFFASLSKSGVRYYFGGHDHLHNRAVVTSPDGACAVQDIIAASTSYKFYVPMIPAHDVRSNGPPREIPLSQELRTLGFYVVAVDGPRVTADFYSAPIGCGGDSYLTRTPALELTKRETFGYSLNGREFLVRQGEAYTAIEDRHSGTTARILGGVNTSSGMDAAGRPFAQWVTTGWAPRTSKTASDILILRGMESGLGGPRSPTYAISLTYDHRDVPPHALKRGRFGLAAADADGNWIPAVHLNFGGASRFVHGAWNASFPLGTYGVDPSTRTVWAVVNHVADFAAVELKSERGPRAATAGDPEPPARGP
jgi:hypothetical protein